MTPPEHAYCTGPRAAPSAAMPEGPRLPAAGLGPPHLTTLGIARPPVALAVALPALVMPPIR
jgi:hypothetical protein